jgi:hypothetical protein
MSKTEWDKLDSHIKEDERASLVVNLRIQRDWSEMTMLCKGLQGIGIDNIAYARPSSPTFTNTNAI